jgi:hypothetical protein
MKRFLLAAFLALAALAGGAQSSTPQTAPSQAQGDPIPLTLSPKAENPFSRFEIVSLGSFPITLFYAGFVFDLQRYFANGRDSKYAPWPFKNAYSATLTDSDRILRLSCALGASFVVGVADAFLHAKKQKAAERLREAGEASSPQP